LASCNETLNCVMQMTHVWAECCLKGLVAHLLHQLALWLDAFFTV